MLVYEIEVGTSDNSDESLFWQTNFDHRDAILKTEKWYHI